MRGGQDGDSNQDAVIAFLSNPESHGPSAGTVERHTTHGAYVFLVADRAYKLKRAVKRPYFDYSTVELRRAMCERELAINHTIAPQLYLGVRPIVRVGNTLRFGSPEDRNIIDWVVVMRRFDQVDLLEQKRESGTLRKDVLFRLADVIAKFHRNAEITPDRGGACGLRAVTEENVEILRGQVGAPFQNEDVAQYSELLDREFRAVRALLGRRKRQGKVRHCHGDLHLNNVCMFEGEPVLFDALEFSDSLSCIDVLYDLAFILMDIDRHGLRAEANALLNRYLEQTGDYAGLAALPLFLSCRAAIRAHISALRHETWPEAEALLRAASDYLQPKPRLLLAIGGYSGGGKTTLARALAPRLGRAPGAAVLRSDVIRKRIMGVDDTTRLGEEGYRLAMTVKVYEVLCSRCEASVAAGHTAIADAVFGTQEQRQMIEAVAHERDIRFLGIWLKAPAEILKERVESRRADASDATAAVVGRQLEAIIPPENWHTVMADEPLKDLVKQVEALASAPG